MGAGSHPRITRAPTEPQWWSPERSLAFCHGCERLGHSQDHCEAPSLYLQSGHNGLSVQFCAALQDMLGATSVFSGTGPGMWDRTFGFAVFSGSIPEEALAYAFLLYEEGLLTHVPIVTRDGGAHACRDCGQLTEHARIEGRPRAHKSSESPLCPKHRRETVTGRKVRQQAPVTRENPVFRIAPADPSKIGVQRKPSPTTPRPMPGGPSKTAGGYADGGHWCRDPHPGRKRQAVATQPLFGPLIRRDAPALTLGWPGADPQPRAGASHGRRLRRYSRPNRMRQ